MSSFCVNHPVKIAVSKCKRCGKPLCRDCRIQTDSGIYCSNECFAAVKEFEERVAAATPRMKKKSLFSFKNFKSLFLFIIVLAFIYGIFYFIFDVSTIEEMIELIRSWIGM